jgi:RNA polymerase sigma-70 factor (ECF subfamily)
MPSPSSTPRAPHRSQPSAPWRPFVDGLRRFVAGRVPAADAEDVLQDTLLQLHEGADSLRDADRAEAWVFSIARHTIADYYRARERRPLDGPAGTAEDVADEEPAAEALLATYDGGHGVHEEVLSWLRPMAEDLPEMYRRPLLMADFDGHTQREVADALGLSHSGAKSRVQRARKKLGERLRRCCEIEFGPDGRAVDFRRRGACAACRS